MGFDYTVCAPKKKHQLSMKQRSDSAIYSICYASNVVSIEMLQSCYLARSGGKRGKSGLVFVYFHQSHGPSEKNKMDVLRK